MIVARVSLLLLAAQVAAHAQSRDALTGAGVSHELAQLRATQLSHVTYALTLDVTARDSAIGHTRIGFVRKAGGDIVLDFRGRQWSHVKINGADVAPAARNGHLVLPQASLRAGANEVVMDFVATIAPAGASIIRTHDVTDGADYLYTLLVPADANQLFPCFDQPDLKARVSLTLATPPSWTALGNGKLLDSTSAANKTFRFAETEPLSTYLVAFAAGPWKTTSRTIDGRTISIYVRASRMREAESDTLIALNARAIAWLERYTARSFPFQKFDFLLAPAFPFGGMEHPGAVFYNEESFIYRERPTLSQTLGREATIFHEVSHQWFGDFVTMRWFDDLWLKEGFATYLAAVMQADLSPQANAWKTFYLRNKPTAYGVDASSGTTPVWQQLANLDQAKSNYGAIVYNKAPGILKQLNYLVGDTAFRDGLRSYVKVHAYGNATWNDLLSSVGAAAHRDLSAWGRQYIRRPGLPVITQSITGEGANRRLVLSQAPARTLSGKGSWPVRLQVAVARGGGAVDVQSAELKGPQTNIPLGAATPDFVFANAGDFAYALIQLDDKSRSWLTEHVGQVRDDFLRATLWGALWDDVRAARMDPRLYISAALRELPAERDEQIAPVLLGRVSRAVSAYVSATVRDSVMPHVEQVLLGMARDTSRSYGIRKNNLDTYIALASTPASLRLLDSMLDSSSLAGSPLRAPTRWSIITSLVSHSAPSAGVRLAAESAHDSTTEGKRRAFVAGAAEPSAAVKANYFRRYFADRDLNEDWVTASLRAFHDPSHEDLSRPYLIPALDSLAWVQKNRRIFFLGNWLGATLDGQRSPEALADVDGFLASHKLPRDLREKILQSRDELERTVGIRRAFR